MAKKGMKRPERTHTHPRDPMDPVPELQGKARSGKQKAAPRIPGTEGPGQRVFHTEPPVTSDVYPAIDTDLGLDNLQNDIPGADRNEL